MRLLSTLLTAALAGDAVLASTWFTKQGAFVPASLHPPPAGVTGFIPPDLSCVPANATLPAAYNKWHETELERWLSDHEVPYPTPADRKDLENLIHQNWETYAVAPYKTWDADALQAYLHLKGVEAKRDTVKNKDALVSQVAGVWYETEDKAQNAWSNVKDWILDTWTESKLKEFADKHDIPGK